MEWAPLSLKKPDRAVFTWLSKGIGFGFGFGFTTPFGWLVYLLWFWFYDSQVKTALSSFNWRFSSRPRHCWLSSLMLRPFVQGLSDSFL